MAECKYRALNGLTRNYESESDMPRFDCTSYCRCLKLFFGDHIFSMSWFSSNRNEGSNRNEDRSWPPMFQSFEEYKDELYKAIKEHPPFGEWLLNYRNVNHMFNHTQQPMWELSVEQLKERYLISANVNNRTKNAKRTFIEMYLNENNDAYQKDEDDLRARMKSYNLAMDAFNEAQSHGYRNVTRPKEPQKTNLLVERDRLHRELEKLV